MILAGAASAQDYPFKPITLIVPWPAGGPTDVDLCGPSAEAAEKHLGQPILSRTRRRSGDRWPGDDGRDREARWLHDRADAITVYRLPLMQKTTWTRNDFTYIIGT